MNKRYSPNAVDEFLELNKDLQLVTDDGVHIEFIEGRRMIGWIDMYVRIDDKTNRAHIERAFNLVKEWRERLNKFQHGIWSYDGANQLYETLMILKNQGWEYNELANSLNQYIAELVRQGNKKKAIALMKDMGVKTTEAEILYRDARQNISQGKEAFGKGYPLDKDKVRPKMNDWENRRYIE